MEHAEVSWEVQRAKVRMQRLAQRELRSGAGQRQPDRENRAHAWEVNESHKLIQYSDWFDSRGFEFLTKIYEMSLKY